MLLLLLRRRRLHRPLCARPVVRGAATSVANANLLRRTGPGRSQTHTHTPAGFCCPPFLLAYHTGATHSFHSILLPPPSLSPPFILYFYPPPPFSSPPSLSPPPAPSPFHSSVSPLPPPLSTPPSPSPPSLAPPSVFPHLSLSLSLTHTHTHTHTHSLTHTHTHSLSLFSLSLPLSVRPSPRLSPTVESLINDHLNERDRPFFEVCFFSPKTFPIIFPMNLFQEPNLLLRVFKAVSKERSRRVALVIPFFQAGKVLCSDPRCYTR